MIDPISSKLIFPFEKRVTKRKSQAKRASGWLCWSSVKEMAGCYVTNIASVAGRYGMEVVVTLPHGMEEMLA